MTLTEQKRLARPNHYAIKAKRTELYRLLYGQAEGNDPQGHPELNSRRKLPQDYSHQNVKAAFETWAEKIFPPRRYRELAERLEALRRFKAASN